MKNKSTKRAFLGILASCSLLVSELHGENLPPVDRTSVDRVIEALGGQIPFPPEVLFTTLESRGFRIQGAAVVPTGRNFEKGSTTYSQPRSEFAVNPGPFDSSGMPIDASKTVFFAYTPSNQQLQIIGASSSKPFDSGFSRDIRLAFIRRKRDTSLTPRAYALHATRTPRRSFPPGCGMRQARIA